MTSVITFDILPDREVEGAIGYVGSSVDDRSRTFPVEIVIDNPAALPPPTEVLEIAEPWMTISVVCPDRYIGVVMELVTGRRGAFDKMEYLQGEDSHQKEDTIQVGDRRVLLQYQIPLSEILVDFYDQLKSMTHSRW